MNKNPWAGWVAAGLIAALAVGLYFYRMNSGGNIYSPESMTEMLTIRYTDTDDVERIPRGRLDKMIRGREKLDPSEGLINPKTGKPTGILVNEKDWNEMFERIKREKAQAKEEAKSGNSPFGPVQKTPAKPK
ncbi:MAG: hypothetical protein U0640_14630 [Phycisphaerales bacterium]